jgi:hypothetical protein
VCLVRGRSVKSWRTIKLKTAMAWPSTLRAVLMRMLLSAPIISPDFDEWLTALVSMRAGIGNDATNFLLIMVPAIIGGVGLVANVM